MIKNLPYEIILEVKKRYMDIAITLPKKLWEKIVSGEKVCELRKECPRRFTMGSNVVYVILKGTKDVVGYFTILSMSPVRINDAVRCKNLICADAGWIAKYLDYGNQKGYLWIVGDVNVFFPHSKNIVDLHLKSNPQSFCYIK